MNEKIFCLKTDGISCFTGGTSGYLRLTDLSSEKEKYKYQISNSYITSIFVSTDGSNLVCGTNLGNFNYYAKK
jgi:hypothetical protein